MHLYSVAMQKVQHLLASKGYSSVCVLQIKAFLKDATVTFPFLPSVFTEHSYCNAYVYLGIVYQDHCARNAQFSMVNCRRICLTIAVQQSGNCFISQMINSAVAY